MRSLTYIIALLSVFSVGTGNALAALDEEKWESLTRDLDYTEIQEKPTVVEGSDSSGFGDLIAPLMQIWPYVALGVLVIIVVYILFKKVRFNNDKPQKGKVEIEYQNIEENLDEADIDALLNKALKAEDHRAALRLYFLKTLQKLNARKIIRHENRKTNRDYLYEIKDTELRLLFADLAASFDWFWYGKKPVGKADFDHKEQMFRAFLNKVEK